MRLTVVGCGDAFGSGGRFNTCFMVESGDRTILLDCGASSLVALRAHNIDINRIDGIVLTHLHGDHFGGIPFFLLDSQFLSRRDRPLTIAGPPGTRVRIEAALEVFFPSSSGSKWRFPWPVVEMEIGPRCKVLGFEVETAEVKHLSGASSTAVRLNDGERILAYSGDTEWTDALIRIADGADLFITECYNHDGKVTGHMSWTELKTRLPDLQARRIMLTHMNPTMLAEQASARAAGLLVAEDGLVIDV
jgi:ribonuclease BN (tRNA processing enzyme)